MNGASSVDLTLQKCRELIREKRLIPFIGAGLSTRFRFPSWAQLIDLVAEELGWDPDVFKLSGNFLQLAEYYVIERGSIGTLRSKLDKLFSASDEQIHDSRSHVALAKLSPPLIYTTNYEDSIERAFRLSTKPYHVISNIRDIAAIDHGATQIVKFHGTFSDDASLVLTESSYFERMEFETALDIKLRADILGRTLLFVGYGFGDINVRYVMYKLHKLRVLDKSLEDLPTGIMTTFSPGEVQRKVLNQWGVLTLELDPIDKDKSIDDFLEALL